MLKFRPHHFLCTLGFEGKGYSADFVRNFSKIAEALRGKEGDSTEIQVIRAADSICSPCPNRKGTDCLSSEKIDQLDEEHSKVLGIKSGDQLTWGQAKSLLAEKMTLGDFDRACAPCSWKALGVCEAALKRLKGVRSIGILVLSLFALQAASGVNLAWSRPIESSEIRTLDTLRESILPPRIDAQAQTSKKAKTKKKKDPPLFTEKIRKAHEALQAGKTDEAIQFALKIQKDILFGDYGYWMESAAKLEEARKSLRAHRYKEANSLASHSIRNSLKIISDHPYSPMIRVVPREIGAAELIKASAHCAQKKWTHCLETFENAFQRYLGNSSGSGELWSLQPEFLESYGEACARVNLDRCAPWLGKFAWVFPKNSPEFKALSKHLSAPPERIRQVSPPVRGTKLYRAPDLDQAAFDAAIAEYLEKKYSNAGHLFQKFLEEYPRSTYRFRAQYWLARALSQQKKTDEAKKVFETLSFDSPLTFYGLLAAQQTGKDIGSAIAATIPAAVQREPGLLPIEVYRLERAESLLRGGAPALAALELKDLKFREAHSNAFLIYLAMLDHEAGNHFATFSILSELIQRGYQGVQTSYVLNFIFPQPFFEVVQTAASENKVDPILLLSLIKQESSFDASAVSSSGAQGLTQLMPTTALDVAPEMIRAELVDVKNNVKTGAKYMSKLLTRFNGNIALALAGYNAGPNAVDRWIKANPQRTDLLEFIESIPYRETREYVAAIIRNYFWYSRFLKSENREAMDLNYFWAGGYKPRGALKPDETSSE